MIGNIVRLLPGKRLRICANGCSNVRLDASSWTDEGIEFVGKQP
jgi:hypothetical protein